MFVAPSSIKKSSFDDIFFFRDIIELPIIAACPDPSPGRKLHKGELIVDAISGFVNFACGLVIS